jgi:hypothetical protein
MRVVVTVAGVVVALGFLHIWQNIGFENLGIGDGKQAAEGKKFRVGFLPVT